MTASMIALAEDDPPSTAYPTSNVVLSPVWFSNVIAKMFLPLFSKPGENSNGSRSGSYINLCLSSNT